MSAGRGGPDRLIRTVALVAKGGAEQGVEIAREIGAWLGRRGVRALYDAETAARLGQEPDFARHELPAQADLAIAVGGDGTLLAVARAAVPLGLPLLGVNLGSLGFLTELQPSEVFEGLEAVLAGRYGIEERQTLRVRWLRQGSGVQEHAVLNDAVLTKSALARMVVIGLRVDDEDVAIYTSDGLIVASPTGSTAYSLSAGGPILDPRVSAFVIAPICPHTMTYRPLVVPGSVRLAIRLSEPSDAVYLTLDGQIGSPFGAGDELRIERHDRPARLVRVAGRSFFELLRRKLRWGER